MSDVNTVTIARNLLEALIDQHITAHGHTNAIARSAQLSLDRHAPVQVPDGMAQRPYAWAWEQHAWVVTAHGKHRGIRKSMDVCQPPIQTQESDDFIRMFPLYEHAPVQVPDGWKLVPVEPTPEMLAAVSWPGCARTDYAHMLAAAPAKEGE